jgi:hypothetical protein
VAPAPTPTLGVPPLPSGMALPTALPQPTAMPSGMPPMPTGLPSGLPWPPATNKK